MADLLASDGPARPGSATVGIYCLVPADLADELLEPLREHYCDVPSVEVIVDRRVVARRRSGVDRRSLNIAPPDLAQKRSGIERRRSADRRAPQLPRNPALPDVAIEHRDRIRFVQRLPPVSAGDVISLSLDDLVLRIQDGDAEAATEFYWRLFERVYSHIRSTRGRYARPDEHMVSTFGVLLDRVGEYRPGGRRPFDEWLYEVLDAHLKTLPPDADDGGWGNHRLR